MKQEKQTTRNEELEVYEKPRIQIVEMEMESPLLNCSVDKLKPGGGVPWS